MKATTSPLALVTFPIDSEQRMPSTQELFGDDDSSDDDKQPESLGDKTAPAANETEAEADKAKPRPGPLDDSEDDDDDAPQFNDDTVVGLKSTTIAGHKLNAQTSRTTSNDRMDDRDDGYAPISPPKEPAQPAISTKTMIVQQPPTTRPTKLHFTKLPNILGVQTEAFHPDTYSAAAEEEDYGQAAFNLMRWRYQTDSIGHLRRSDDDEKLIRESNTRLVEWEDGSYTLHVGPEIFNVDLTDSSTPGFPGLNGYLYLSQSATVKDSAHAVTDEEGNETIKEVSAGTVLECMGPMASRMVVRPSSLQSEAHKSLTVGIRQKTIKKARIAEFVTQEDPEKLKLERIKVKDDLEKAAFRKNRSSYGGSLGGGSGYNRSSPGRPRMSRDYLEDDRDFDTTNIKAMKRRTMGGDYDDKEDMDDYGDDSDDDDDDNDETFRKVRPGRANKSPVKNKASKRVESDDEDEMFMGDDDDDEDAPVAQANRGTKKRSHQAVVDDDDSE